MFVPQWIIERKRDGETLTDEEIRFFVQGITDGSIPDYQISAWAMTVYFRGMTTQETATLTDAMMRSGDLLNFTDAPRPTADKHSTGGIGDKISIVLAPLAAAAGLCVPMISGRGLGITGGTLDKLDTIPGFKTQLPVNEFKRITCDLGCCMVGQTERLAPADRRLYALRDVTGTVPSIPLITGSIMSKKLAEGAQSLVFDVKVGSGAFMKTATDARKLADSLIRTGRALGRRCAAVITDMDEPLGRTVGNALEIEECIAVLQGKGPADIRELTFVLTARMMTLSGVAPDTESALEILEELIAQGTAWEIFQKMVAAQGGDVASVTTPGALPQAACAVPVPAPKSGFVARVAADGVGQVALQLGAGRRKTDDIIDPGAGVCRLVQHGEAVQAGEPLMELRCANLAMAEELVAEAVRAVAIQDTPPPPRQLIIEN